MQNDHTSAYSPKISFHLVEVFLFLQVLDVFTTLTGLRVGLAEASPFVRVLLSFGPFEGLLASKVIAVLLGAYCLRTGRMRVIRIINYWYAALVVWNLSLVLAVLSGSRSI